MSLLPYPPQEIRRAAQTILTYGIRNRLVIPATSCEDCGGTTNGRALDGHHTDYSKPLEVVWLCRSCHENRHSEMAHSIPVPKLELAKQWLRDNPTSKLSNRKIAEELGIAHTWVNKARSELAEE